MDEKIPKPVKGKEKANDQNESSETQEKGASLASKIVASASGLARDFAHGSDGELASILASSSAIGSKSQSSNTTAGSSAWRNEVAATRTRTSGSSQIPNSNAPTAFRSLQTQAPVDPQMNEFLSDTTFSPQQSKSDVHSTSAWASQFNRVPEPNAAGYTTSSGRQRNEPFIPDVHDGAEVSQLLSEPTFSADADTMEMGATADLTQEQVNDLFPQEFTDTENHMVNYMKSNLPPPPTHKPVPWDHPLNLRPAELMQVEDPETSLEKGLDGYFASPQLRDRWLSEWNDILNSYTDEVWGELLPEVKTARTELEAMRVGGNSYDAKAVARLMMILGHVNQQGLPGIQPPSELARRAWSGEDENSSKPEYHCPWVSCREVRF